MATHTMSYPEMSPDGERPGGGEEMGSSSPSGLRGATSLGPGLTWQPGPGSRRAGAGAGVNEGPQATGNWSGLSRAWERPSHLGKTLKESRGEEIGFRTRLYGSPALPCMTGEVHLPGGISGHQHPHHPLWEAETGGAVQNSGREAAEARMDVQGKDKTKTSKQAKTH